MNREKECRLLARMSQPIGLNLAEEWMVYNIYCREMAVIHRRFLRLVLCGAVSASLGCTVAKPAPLPPTPPAPYVCSSRPIRVMSIQGVDAQGNSIEGPAMALDTAICQCSDGVVRTCR